MVGNKAGTPKLFFLVFARGAVMMANEDGSDPKALVDKLTGHPDGIGVDVANKHIYFTLMGDYLDMKTQWSPKNDGSIMRVDFDGENLTTIVPIGGTHTPKQLTLDLKNRKIYWSDREGMRVMRSNMDGSNVETLVTTGHGDDVNDLRNWCVGIAVDLEKNHIYWTQKGPPKGNEGKLLRAGLNIPKGQTSENRSDIEVLFDGLPEPIDLLLDDKNKILYWTDRGRPPAGNTLNCIPLDKLGQKEHAKVDILEGGFTETIGVAADFPNNRVFITDLGGKIYVSGLDGKGQKVLMHDLTPLTGIEFAII